ncbi:hypothetical protein I350_01922 [Cryptococcus amylolentus CBS 6273]|uniref:Alginate lyase domain-containing protein n=1 Tax=Cryptococcus amylolentus CBS 6273 TaxID=1296118 RepID=A0A1E3KAY3_9TREE|nr:hypothetical protein I350_01922 [Cryptococcus amylolentus CBS 6273]
MSLPIPFQPSVILTPQPSSTPTPAALRALLPLAKDILKNDVVYSVTFSKMLCPEGKNYLFTLKPYYWEVAPGVWKRRDGQRNPYCDLPGGQIQLQGMATSVHTLALAALHLGDEVDDAGNPLKVQCLGHIERLLRVFFLDEATRMVPEVWYSQCIPGWNPLKGDYAFAIAIRYLILVSQALVMVSPMIPGDVVDGMRSWLGVQVEWMKTSEQGEWAKNYGDNKTLWYHAIIASHLSVTEAEEGAKRYADELVGQWRAQYPTAETFFARDLRRTRPRHYALFALQPLFILARLTGQSSSPTYSPTLLQYLTELVDLLSHIEPGAMERPLEDEGGRYEAVSAWYQKMLSSMKGHGEGWEDEPDGNGWEGGWQERAKVSWGFV